VRKERLIEKNVNRIYQHLPVPLQNLLISLKGLTYKKQRFGKYYHQEVNILKKYRYASLKELKQLQRERLISFLSFAKENSVFYKDIDFDDSSHSCEKILSTLPILSKKTLKNNLKAVSSNLTKNRKKLYWTSTSGTTGTAMQVAFTIKDLQYRFAAVSRQLDEVGVGFGQRCARFSARTIIRDEGNITSISRKNWFNKEEIYSSFFISKDNAGLYLKALNKQKPIWATGFPSSFYALAKQFDNNELRKLGIKAIMPTGETLTNEQRDFIESSYGARVINQYGSAEGAPLITECKYGNLHCNLETGVFEFFPEKDNKKFHRMIVTSFTTHAFPLIRYDIGDAVELSDNQDCACGYKGTIVKSILGRLDDFIHSPQRGWVGRIGGVFKACPDHVIEAQIAQTDLNTLEFRYVSCDGELNSTERKPILDDLALRVGDAMEIKFIRLNEIPRSANGKFKTAVGLQRDNKDE